MAIHIKKSHEGLLHKDLGVATDKPIPAKKLAKAEHSENAAVKKRAVFAENAKHWHHGGHHVSEPHQFSKPPANGAHGYGHTERHGALRMSGHPGAHRIGSK
jgi:hypothetical protein